MSKTPKNGNKKSRTGAPKNTDEAVWRQPEFERNVYRAHNAKGEVIPLDDLSVDELRTELARCFDLLGQVADYHEDRRVLDEVHEFVNGKAGGHS
jgi:hypothetical protein